MDPIRLFCVDIVQSEALRQVLSLRPAVEQSSDRLRCKEQTQIDGVYS